MSRAQNPPNSRFAGELDVTSRNDNLEGNSFTILRAGKPTERGGFRRASLAVG
jgi:hypothetical protein